MAHMLRKFACALLACIGIIGTAGAEQITIGVLSDISGPNENFSGRGSVIAAEMAVADFGGSVLGQKIKVIQADHQNKPDIGSSIATRWYENEGVNLIVDVPLSSIALAVEQVSLKAKKVFIANSSSTSAFVEKNCSPYGAMWTYDGYALAKTVADTLVKAGAKKWFMITADYAAGHSVEAAFEGFLKGAGGTVVGRVRHPVGTSDFSSFLLQAKASGADVIGLANFSEDTINTLKQANEFGIAASGQRFAVFFMSLTQIHAAGADIMKNLNFPTAFVWNENEETRQWSKRFFARHNAMPTDFQASVYSSVLHYLKAVRATNSSDADIVMVAMRDAPINDVFTKNGQLRANGAMVHDLYLAEVKDKKDQKEPWDYMKIVKKVPANEAFKPLEQSACPLLTKK